MKNRIETDYLNEQIAMLEQKQSLELKALKEQFHVTYESLKPFNILKSAFNEVTSSPTIKNNLLNNAIGLTTGYLSKRVLVGATHNPLKNIFGTLLQFAIGNVVTKHSDQLVASGGNMLLKFLKNRKAAKRKLLEPQYE
jgi:hypothetical protein